MAVKIKKQLVSKSIANELTYGTGNKKQYIVEHETANTGKGANAQSHANLQSNGNSRDASWHYQVDENGIIQSFNDNYRCWHAGGSYNNNSIGIEICVNSDGNFKKAVENASKLTKYLMKKYNIPKSNVITHKKASSWNKPCPQFLLSGSKGVSWSDFVGMLGGKADKIISEKVKQPAPTPKPKGKLGLVDWMNSKGMDSSKSNRKTLASQYGISGYDFSAKKNTELLNALQKGKPTTNKKAKIKKGAKVTLSNSASEYATGENIPASVKGKTYTVQQVKKNQVLLKEIYSWVYSYDIVGNGAAKASPGKSIATLVEETKAGKHGNGEARKKSLGSNYQAVMDVINGKTSGSSKSNSGMSVSQMASKIINDSNAPTGHKARRKWLGISKSQYEKVRKEVNRRL